MSTFIAIDGGGTKTETVLFQEDGAILARDIREGCNPNIVGLEQSCKTIRAGISAVTDGHNIPVYAGIAGALTGDNAIAMQRRLSCEDLRIRVESDIMNVIYSVDNPGKCIAAIAGTGSSVFAYDGKTLHRAGGWGWIFDNAGSGYDIGRETIRACLACDDGMVSRGRLVDLAEEKLGATALEKLASLCGEGRDYIASFAPLAFEAMREGDETARKIITATVARLAELINFVHSRYDCGNKAVIAGGLTRERSSLEPMIRDSVHSEVELIFPDHDPIFGATRRAIAIFSGQH